VFANLLSNAVNKYQPRPPPVIEIGQSTVEGQLVLFVRDNGAGFNSKYADKLFGTFQRLHTDEEFEGTGVGLATCSASCESTADASGPRRKRTRSNLLLTLGEVRAMRVSQPACIGNE